MSTTSLQLISDADQLVASAIGSEIPNLINELKDLKHNHMRVENRLDEAKDDVCLLDKINIFSKSETEKKRDQLKSETRDLRSEIDDKSEEIRTRLKGMVGKDTLMRCLLTEINHAAGLVGMSTKTATETANHIKSNINELNRQARQHGLGNAPTDAISSLLEDLDLTAQANDRLVFALGDLKKLLAINYGLEPSEYRLDELVERTFQSLLGND